MQLPLVACLRLIRPSTYLQPSAFPSLQPCGVRLSSLKKAGETYDSLLADMIEREKKQRLVSDLKRIEARGKFVEMKW